MKKYFYAEGKEQKGPFSFEELKNHSINRKTLIWYYGLSDWQLAETIGEFDEFFELEPSPIKILEYETISENNSEKVEEKTEEIIPPKLPKNKSKTSEFSFEGRIGRVEYAFLSIIWLIIGFSNYVLNVIHSIINSIIDSQYQIMFIDIIDFLFGFIVIWAISATGAKRCHDMGKNGWWQFIPFYFIWLLFAEGEKNDNQYGKELK